MPTLADLNRQKRDYASSGMAQEADIPYLYALFAGDRGRPAAGIGDQQGGGAEATGAPNPLASGGGGVGGTGGGGASGGADIGMPGPGQTGLGEDIDQLYQQYLFSRGGQAGEPGPGGYQDSPVQNVDAFNELGGYSTLGTAAGLGLGIPGLGFLGSIVDTYNDYSRTKEFNPSAPTDFEGFLESLISDVTGGLFGQTQFNREIGRYQDETGTGLNRNALAASTSGTSYSGPKGVVGPQGGGVGESAFDKAINELGGPDLGFFGGGGASETGGVGETSGQGGGGSAGSQNSIFHSGGYVSEDNVPGQLRGDVDATLQEGEGVLTADAVSVLGPGFVHGVNMMAKMMRQG